MPGIFLKAQSALRSEDAAKYCILEVRGTGIDLLGFIIHVEIARPAMNCQPLDEQSVFCGALNREAALRKQVSRNVAWPDVMR